MNSAPRLIRLEDDQALANLHRRCFGDEAWSSESFRGLLELPGCFGWMLEAGPAKNQRRLDALLLARQAADEAEVLTLCVRPERQRQGLARQLLAQLTEHLFQNGAIMLFLEVSVNNAAALALYHDLGFSEVGRRANYYEPGDSSQRVDACMLALPLRS